MRIACILIAYNPVLQSLKSNIQTYYEHVDFLYLINNSTYKIENLFTKMTIVNNHENLGIAKALNMGCELAIEDGFDYVLTMDQDSYFTSSMAKSFFQNAITLFNSIQNLGVVTPCIQESGQDTSKISEDFIYKNTVITSGNIVKLDAYKAVSGGFDDRLFIDGVDLDFCFKLRLQNFRIIEFTSIQLRHEIGKAIERKKMFSNAGIKYIMHLHNPIRQYYAARNNLYLVKKYRKQFPDETTHIILSLLFKIKNNLFHNNEKLKGLKMTTLGIFHFIIGRYGKL